MPAPRGQSATALDILVGADGTPCTAAPTVIDLPVQFGAVAEGARRHGQ
jgi:hypothetical protein